MVQNSIYANMFLLQIALALKCSADFCQTAARSADQCEK